jgi:hypothetical protein
MSYFVECPRCEAIITAEIRGEIQDGPDDNGDVRLVTLVQCSKCEYPLLAFRDYVGSDDEGNSLWSDPERLWPLPPMRLSGRIPSEIRGSLEEAYKCFRCTAHTASVVMSGRALEGLCRHFYPSGTERNLMLAAGLKKLYEDKIIDTRLYEWGEALTEDRNLAAHPSGIHFKRDDAEAVFKFTNSICEYVFVLTEDFKDYMKRRMTRLRL